MKQPRALLSVVLLIGLVMANETGIARSLKHGPFDGAWGGDRMLLEISRSGGKLETDCASGEFPGPIKQAKDGSFSVRGTFHEHQAGPQKIDDLHNAVSARFHGRMQNGILHLSIITAGDRKGRHYALRKGAHVKLVRCY